MTTTKTESKPVSLGAGLFILLVGLTVFAVVAVAALGPLATVTL